MKEGIIYINLMQRLIFKLQHKKNSDYDCFDQKVKTVVEIIAFDLIIALGNQAGLETFYGAINLNLDL